MQRVVITGYGIVSCLGNNKSEVLTSLKAGTSGISYNDSYKQQGLRSQIAGSININLKDHIGRKDLRFMGSGSAYAYIAMQEAIEHSGLIAEQISNERTGLIIGAGGTSSDCIVASVDTLRAKGIRRVGPYVVTKTMGSGISATLATPYKIKGLNYSLSSACATSAHCIGLAMEQIQFGKQDVIFAGGGEEEHWSLSMMFDAMGALSSKYNHTPETASRPYDQTRDGFVIAGGAGVVVLESLEYALARGANIIAEVVGYGATSDGDNMVAPSGEGAVRCMNNALSTVTGKIDYLNAHGTSTPIGDLIELKAISAVFKNQSPKIASTKSLSGHSLGAAGVHEAIYSIQMMQNNFIAASANLTQLDEKIDTSTPIVSKTIENIELNTVMSNSFGFGGTNASLVFQKFSD
ncbi:3-oxoacyl-[acyl-carrier-protein] synthase, KASI [hydrothermal vent metagenome]|uniref:3-oxoacyl-[acyl-carrier-protein] synthase 1 n=1 Tax=hydrothermal vent metagenome TaxID=652676 RepID=A0A3B0VAW5_9ZZZZ